MKYSLLRPGLPATLLLPALVLTAPADAAAQEVDEPAEARSVRAVLVEEGEIRLDGHLDEEAWQRAPAGSGFMQREPESGAPSTEHTEVRVLYSVQALYVGVRAYDSESDRIRGELARRDQVTQADEIAVYLDTYHDRRTAFMFAVNPRGAIRDIYYSDDQEWGADASWDPVWQVQTSVDSLGWTAEFRIPLTQLRFDPANPTWGLQVRRRIHRNAEVAFWAPYPHEASGFVSHFGTVEGLAGLSQPRRLELRPYTLMRTRHRPEGEGILYAPRQQQGADIGLDLQYGLTADFTLDLAVNPDFGQVEADPAVFNLTAFETFLPERRSFFVEGSGLFNQFIAGGQPFYSRRIGRAPQGFAAPPPGGTVQLPEATRILGAAKVTGKTSGGFGLGVLGAVTSEARATLRDEHGAVHDHAPVEPRTYSAVARAEQDFRDGSHTIGAMATGLRRNEVETLSFLPAGAYLGGIDGVHRWRSNAYAVRWNLAVSHVHGSRDAILRVQRNPLRYFHRPDADHLEIDTLRTAISGYSALIQGGKESGAWRYGGSYQRVSPGFDITDLGFQWQADDQFVWLQGGYVRSRPQWIFRTYEVALIANRRMTIGGETTMQVFPFVYASATFKNNWRIWGNPMNIGWPAQCVTCLRGGPAVRTEARRFHFLGLSTDRRQPVSAGLILNGNSTFGVRESVLNVSPTLYLRPSPVVNGSLGVGYSVRRNPAQWVSQRVVADSAHYVLGELDQHTVNLTARLNWTLAPTLSLEFYAQPFVTAGSYARFRGVGDPQARHFDERFRIYDDALMCEDGACAVDVTGDGSPDFGFARPDFNFRQLRSTAVLRWEYRPGSVLYVAWQHGRDDFARDGAFEPLGELNGLLGLPSDNTLLIKANYWLSF